MEGKKVFIVGIGGVGLSALAQLLVARGAQVSGSDRGESPTTEMLKGQGISIILGHAADNVPDDTDLLMYSDAVYEDNPERMHAKELGILQRSYFEALGDITKEYKLVAVAGAHGKTSTTAMLIDVFEDAGFDPTAIVGSLRAKTKNNFRAGKGKWFIVEADEFKRHFLNFSPQMLVITNIDADHLDYYKDLAEIQSAFKELVQKVPADGFVICDKSNANVLPVIEGAKAQVIDYKPHYDPALPMKALPLHRINAAAVLAAAESVGISAEGAKKSLANFAGTWRRFEYKGKTATGAVVYDDYAHHPAEVSTTLASVREQFPGKRLLVAFHPHTYSRTKLLMGDFAKAFKDADDVVLAPIFAAREKADPAVTSEVLAAKITEEGTPAQVLETFESIAEYLKKTAQMDDLVITMGAGDIYKAGEMLVETSNN